jgi:hypothetical protein
MNQSEEMKEEEAMLRRETERDLMRADCRSLYALAAQWQTTRTYPDWHPKTANDFYDSLATGRNYFSTMHATKTAEAAAARFSWEQASEERGLRNETAQHLARQDCMALASVARQWQDSKAYLSLFPEPPQPIKTHFSAYGRSYFSTHHAQAERAAARDLSIDAMERGFGGSTAGVPPSFPTFADAATFAGVAGFVEGAFVGQETSVKPSPLDHTLEGYLFDLNTSEQPAVGLPAGPRLHSIQPRKIVLKREGCLGRKTLGVPALEPKPAAPSKDQPKTDLDLDLDVPPSPAFGAKGSPVSVNMMDFGAFEEIKI